MPHASTAKTHAFVRFFALALACTAVGCGGDSSSGSPSAPSSTSPAATAVTVTLASPVRMGQTAQASATAALSNGTSQPVTTGWRSDAPSVATVTDGGLVTGVANGQATISVTASGRQGQQLIRVLPDYHGEWDGTLRVTGCTQTGVLAEIRLCDEVPAVNSAVGYDLTLTQTGDSMTALLFLAGTGQTVPAPIAADGSSAFTGRTSYTEEGLTLTFDSSWQINSPRVGALTGTVTDVFRFTGFSGEGRVTYEMLSATRTATSVRSSGGRTRHGIALQGLGRRLRLSQ